MLRASLPLLHKADGGRILQILDANLVEEVMKHEGKYPNKGSLLGYFKLLRGRRKGM